MNNSLFELHPSEKFNNKWKYVYLEKSEVQQKYFCGDWFNSTLFEVYFHPEYENHHEIWLLDVESTTKIPKKVISRMKVIFVANWVLCMQSIMKSRAINNES